MHVKFSIEASGDNLQFQWRKDGSDLNSDGVKYWGVNTDTLYIVAAEGSDEGDYRCLVENDVGELFSDKALLSFGKLLALLTPYVVVSYTTKTCNSFCSNLLGEVCLLLECCSVFLNAQSTNSLPYMGCTHIV